MSETNHEYLCALRPALGTSNSKGTGLITGASSGIGAIYADRLAHRGYDLILVARNRERLDALAKRLIVGTGRTVEAIVADLNDKADLARVGHLLRTDDTISLLVNNAGVGVPPPLLDSAIDKVDRMIELNVTALVHLTYAIVPGFLSRGGGAIINLSSALGIAPELLNGVYGARRPSCWPSAYRSIKSLPSTRFVFRRFCQVRRQQSFGICLERRLRAFPVELS